MWGVGCGVWEPTVPGTAPYLFRGQRSWLRRGLSIIHLDFMAIEYLLSFPYKLFLKISRGKRGRFRFYEFYFTILQKEFSSCKMNYSPITIPNYVKVILGENIKMSDNISKTPYLNKTHFRERLVSGIFYYLLKNTSKKIFRRGKAAPRKKMTHPDSWP